MHKLKFFLIILFSFFKISQSLSQTRLDEIISHCQGYKQDRSLFFEVEGYKVIVQYEDQGFNDHGLFILRNRYFIEKDAKYTSDTALRVKNRTYVLTSKLNKELNKYEVFCFIEDTEKEIKLVKFIRAGQRDVQLEQLFTRAILRNLVPQKQFLSSLSTDTVNFGDKKIICPVAGRWMSPHNLNCGRQGHLNWAEFATLDKANDYLKVERSLAGNGFEYPSKLLSENEVSVVFENVTVKAIKTKWKIRVPKILMGGSNELIIYYVSGKVGSSYFVCVMSHYSDEAPEGQLPLLLKEVIQLN